MGPESLKFESASQKEGKKEKKKKVRGVLLKKWTGKKNEMLCCQRREPLIVRCFVFSVFPLLKPVNAGCTQSSAHRRTAERFGERDPKTKWVIKLPLWLCVPAQLWLIFAKENKVVHFICMLKDSLPTSCFLQYHNYLECEMLFRYS